MAETLGQKQERFSLLLSKLITHIYESGYQVRFGEVKRSDEQAEINALGETGRSQVASLLRHGAAGIGTFTLLAATILNNGKAGGVRASLHQQSLAADLNLFKDGVYLDKDTDHEPFGTWWEEQAPDCRWGGRFKDGNHYSIEHNGVK